MIRVGAPAFDGFEAFPLTGEQPSTGIVDGAAELFAQMSGKPHGAVTYALVGVHEICFSSLPDAQQANHSHPRRRLLSHDGSRMTGSSASPRKAGNGTVSQRTFSGSPTRVMPGWRPKSVVRAICISRRARGAPMQ